MFVKCFCFSKVFLRVKHRGNHVSDLHKDEVPYGFFNGNEVIFINENKVNDAFNAWSNGEDNLFCKRLPEHG